MLPLDALLLLLIDDNELLLRVLRKLLAEQGARTLSATDGREGLLLAEEHQPDAVICDLHLPGFDGLEVLAEVRARDSIRHVPFILHTTQSADAFRTRAADLGADAYVRKGVDFDVLVETIRTLTRR